MVDIYEYFGILFTSDGRHMYFIINNNTITIIIIIIIIISSSSIDNDDDPGDGDYWVLPN